MDWWTNLNIQTQISIIVVLISVISLIVNTVVNLMMKRKDIRANIVSKARITWIENTRLISTKIITAADRLFSGISDFIRTEELRNEMKDSNVENFNEIHEEINSFNESNFDIINESNQELLHQATLLKLYYSENPENNKVINKSEELLLLSNKAHEKIAQYGKQKIDLQNYKASSLEIQNQYNIIINEFVEIIRDYNKKEWNKVKKGK